MPQEKTSKRITIKTDNFLEAVDFKSCGLPKYQSLISNIMITYSYWFLLVSPTIMTFLVTIHVVLRDWVKRLGVSDQ